MRLQPRSFGYMKGLNGAGEWALLCWVRWNAGLLRDVRLSHCVSRPLMESLLSSPSPPPPPHHQNDPTQASVFRPALHESTATTKTWELTAMMTVLLMTTTPHLLLPLPPLPMLPPQRMRVP